MEKKPYTKPIVEKITFDYTEQIVASSDNKCNPYRDHHDDYDIHGGHHGRH